MVSTTRGTILTLKSLFTRVYLFTNAIDLYTHESHCGMGKISESLSQLIKMEYVNHYVKLKM